MTALTEFAVLAAADCLRRIELMLDPRLTSPLLYQLQRCPEPDNRLFFFRYFSR